MSNINPWVWFLEQAKNNNKPHNKAWNNAVDACAFGTRLLCPISKLSGLKIINNRAPLLSQVCIQWWDSILLFISSHHQLKIAQVYPYYPPLTTDTDDKATNEMSMSKHEWQLFWHLVSHPSSSKLDQFCLIWPCIILFDLTNKIKIKRYDTKTVNKYLLNSNFLI